VLIMVVFKVDGTSAVGGVLGMLVGMFAAAWRTAFDFEFGSSRSSKDKDVVISSMKKSHG
jgi:hypothetical protein